jgi:succinyl-diaminopimelate desuccinylase
MNNNEGLKQQLLTWIDQDREKLITFFAESVRCPSPNPPGDTRSIAKHFTDFLSEHSLPFKIIAPKSECPNIVGTFDCALPGRHLSLNGHMDVYPVNNTDEWQREPFSGAIENDRIHGRGATDMKCGTCASVLSFAYLHRLRSKLAGRVTLSAVSDEETGGQWGTGYLVEHHPEILGDCCLNGEPGSPDVIRIGEKGVLWARFKVVAPAGHGGYPHRGGIGAIALAARLIVDLEQITQQKNETPIEIRQALEEARTAIERGIGTGVVETVQAFTVNIGKIQGGVKISLKPTDCIFDVDIRLPIGADKKMLMEKIKNILQQHPSASMEELIFAEPNASDPCGEMAVILQDTVHRLRGSRPPVSISIGGSDTRFWRYRGIPAYIYGPTPNGTGAANEYVEIEEFLHVLRTHALSAIEYLSRSRG